MKPKFNAYQKLILLVYGCLFVYFTILHVPFRTSYRNEIKYDTLFSNNSNLDFSRLVLIIIIFSILATVLFLLFRNINFSFKRLPRKTIKVTFYSTIALILLLSAILVISEYQTKTKNIIKPIVKVQTIDSTSIATDTTSIATDTTRSIDAPPFIKKIFNCTEEHALENFRSYMKFYYPDWKIYGKPVVKEQSDCIYRIQFTTLDPHSRYEREVIIVEISYNYDYSRYNFTTIRGTLY